MGPLRKILKSRAHLSTPPEIFARKPCLEGVGGFVIFITTKSKLSESPFSRYFTPRRALDLCAGY